MLSSAKDWALELARRGIAVFPLQPGTKIPYSKDDCSKADWPFAGGTHIATTNPVKIEKWFSARPDLNYGVRANDLVILDVDVRDGKQGLESLAALGELPPTFTVVTPSGGLHYYWCGPGAGQRDLAPGINVRSINGYVAGPGSIFQGRTYQVLDDGPLADLPPEIRSRLSAPGEKLEQAPPLVELDTPAATEHAAAWLRREPGALKGERGSTAYRLAARLKDFGLSEDAARDALDAHWAPRCMPPALPEDFHAEVAHAFQYGRSVPGCAAVTAEFVDVPAALQDIPEAAPEPAAGNFQLLDVSRGPGALPKREWLVPDLILKKGLTGLVAPPGAGKSTFSLALAIGLARGDLTFLGFGLKDAPPKKVVLINNEDDEDEMRRRIFAICSHHGIDWLSVQGQIITHRAIDSSPFLGIGRHPKARVLAKTKRYGELEATIAEHRAAIFIVDPFVEMHQADEKDNTELAQVMGYLRGTTDAYHCAGLLVHHTRKPPQASSESYAGDMNSARGGGAFSGTCRAVYTLYSMDEKDGAKYGVRKEERGQYTRLDVAKGNYVPRGSKPRWYKSVSIHLPNGDSAPALEVTDVESFETRNRDHVHRMLADTVVKEGGNMPLEDAAKILKNDEMYGALSQARRVKIVTECFKDPIILDSIGLQIVGNELQGWAEDRP